MPRSLVIFLAGLVLLPGAALAAAVPDTFAGCSFWGMIAALGLGWAALNTIRLLVLSWLPAKPRQPQPIIIESLPAVPAHEHKQYVLVPVFDAEIKSIRDTLASMERNLGREIGQVKVGQDAIIELLMRGVKS